MTVIETSGSRKSPDAFRTISEVAVDLDVPQHVLRFWESKFAQIKPLKRGGGRRYYRPEDVDLLRGVRALLYKDGYTIKGVQKVFRDQGVRFVIETGRAAGEESVAGLARASVQRASEGAADGASGLGSDARAVLGGIAKRLADLQAELDKSVAKDSADL
ncbi:MAG: MerR family transcriptional regulator [Rhodobiaceae bacterium]|nr:MerR family transcriptional regulator [Rhodobiaceae bacterium]